MNLNRVQWKKYLELCYSDPLKSSDQEWSKHASILSGEIPVRGKVEGSGMGLEEPSDYDASLTPVKERWTG